MNHLNDRQKQAVLTIDCPLLVLAGAGSGKTSVITQKIAYLIQDCGFKARNIAALTFTNKAAREMKERVRTIVKGRASHGLIVSTFHNLGLNIIRKEASYLGLRSGFTLFDQQDAHSLIKNIVQAELNDQDEHIDMFQNKISAWKNDLWEPATALSKAQDDLEQMAALVFDKYNSALKAYNAVDFDDLIRLPVQLFHKHEDVLAKWQKKIRYMLVDEYQDTNISQYILVKMLVGARNRFTVVGDDDQSIYSWRGARPENLVKLKEDFPSLEIIKLEQNYRSTSLILNAANVVIDHNPHVFEKKLWSQQAGGDRITIMQCKNDEAEAEWVASQIIFQKLNRKLKFSDFAILYRGNHQARVLEFKLQHHQIPYKLNGGQSFFGKAEIKDVMSYLRLMINTDDNSAFLRIVNTPRREIGPVTIEKLNHFAEQNQLGLFESALHPQITSYITGTSGDRIHRFANWVAKTQQKLHTIDNPIQAIKEMLADIQYEVYLQADSNTPEMALKRMKNVWMLVDNIDYMFKKNEEDDGEDELTIADAIGKLILRDMMERQEDEDQEDAVQLMTLHSSKGLEFPHVHMIGLEEELLPHRNSIESDDIEEERRLMYVGITRAKKVLTISYAAQRKQFGESIDCTPSRFLDELPQEDISWKGAGQSTKETTQETGSQALAGLRALFDDS
ncbi:DNA helicase Rep [Marinicellulosiphila megalodicopiae]|uniref:DNA helicase Rep n=1 Tax=Marinicellulosiphila megalodicopiae TaxID=2724896 RepID=UPI003BAEEB95